MAQAEGSSSIMVIANELTFKSPPSLVVENCEDAWNEQVDGDCTATLDAADFKVGAGSAKFEIAVGMSAGDIACTEAIVVASLASYTHLGFWIKSSVLFTAGQLQILLDDTANCASPLETLNVPATAANTWTFHTVPLANPATDLLLISIGLKYTADLGACNVWLDDIRAINTGVVLPFKSEGFRMSQELLESECIVATRNAAQPTLGNIAVDGNVSTELAPYMTRLFKHMLGACVLTGGGAPYTYTFKVAALPAGMTVEKQFTDIGKYFRYDGCKVASWRLSGSAGAISPLELTLMGAVETVAAYPWDGDPTTYTHHPFTSFKAYVKYGGGPTTLGTVTEFSLEGNNNLDGSSYVIDSTGMRYSIPSGKVSVTGSITCLFEDTTLYDLAKAGTETKLIFELWHGDGTGTPAGNEKLTITLDEVMLKPEAPAIDGPQGVKITLPFVAFYGDGANASSCTFALLLPNNTTLY